MNKHMNVLEVYSKCLEMGAWYGDQARRKDLSADEIRTMQEIGMSYLQVAQWLEMTTEVNPGV